MVSDEWSKEERLRPTRERQGTARSSAASGPDGSYLIPLMPSCASDLLLSSHMIIVLCAKHTLSNRCFNRLILYSYQIFTIKTSLTKVYVGP